MRLVPRSVFSVTALMLVGCGVHYKFTSTTQVAVVARPASCDFVVLTTPPPRAYLELGVVEWYPPCCAAGDIASFKDAVREDVCRAGGDAVFTMANGDGAYMKGTVLRFQPDGPMPDRAAPSTAL